MDFADCVQVCYWPKISNILVIGPGLQQRGDLAKLERTRKPSFIKREVDKHGDQQHKDVATTIEDRHRD